MNSNIGPQMVKSICKSKAYGETAEKTAEMHGVAVEDVKEIWGKYSEQVSEYIEHLKSLQEG